MYSSKETKSEMNSHQTKDIYHMTHSLSMDNTRCNNNIQKTDKNMLSSIMNMFGSVGNYVSKFPNLMTSINNTLSVTVLPNSTITSEDLLRNLTGSNEHISTNNNNNNMFITKSSNLTELLNSDISSKLLLQTNDNFIDNKILNTNNWIKQIQDNQQTNDLSIAIAESLKIMDKSHNVDNIDKLVINNINNDKLNDDCNKVYKEKIGVDEMVINIDTDVPENQIADDDNDDNDDNDNDVNINKLLSKKSIIKKSRRVIAKKLKKGKDKLQLKKSGISQLKHKKQRTKHNLYSNIQDDLDNWEVNYQNINNFNSNEINNDISQVTDSESNSSYEILPDYPTFIDTYVLDDSRRNKDLKNTNIEATKTIETSSCKNKILSENDIDTSSPKRQRMISNCSIESDDFIVFADSSDCEDDTNEDNDEEDDDDEDDDDDDDDNDDDDDDDDSDCDCSDDDEDEDDDRDEVDFIQPKKSTTQVQFNLQPTVHTMIKWNFAYRAARRGPWEEMARDRDRFKGRIHRVGRVLNDVLTTRHRDCIWQKRFATD